MRELCRFGQFGEHGVLQGCAEDVAYIWGSEEGSNCVHVGGFEGGLALVAVHNDFVVEKVVG